MIRECATNDNLADDINNDDDDEIGQMPADMKDIDGGDKRQVLPPKSSLAPFARSLLQTSVKP